jgi:cytochrome c peroxidase
MFTGRIVAMPIPYVSRRLLQSALVMAVAFCVGGATLAQDFDAAERVKILALSLDRLPPIPSDPSNAAINNPTALALGATLFFDTRLSRNGAVACATCHQIAREFQDGIPLGKGVGTMNRRTQPLAGVAWQRHFFWDGRKDSLWSQALAPLEKDVEHGLTRAWVAHFVAKNFRDRYERVFGPIPDLAGIPVDAGPFGGEKAQVAWESLSAEQQGAVNRVFVNVGKMIGAFERSIAHEETRFDRFARALEAGAADDATRLTEQELDGLRLFVGKAGCATCHTGPRFTDDAFHNTGVQAGQGLPPDRGLAQGADEAAKDEFACGKGFDDAPVACAALPYKKPAKGAFKTPSLRGVASRAPYMHAGQIATLEHVLAHYRAAPNGAFGQSEVKPLQITDAEAAALIAFLKTLD